MDKVRFEFDVRLICSNLLTDREFLEQLKDALEGIPTRDKRPTKGDRVVVARGYKVPIGTEGIIFYENYDYRFDTYRIGIVDDLGIAHWTYKKNVEVVP